MKTPPLPPHAMPAAGFDMSSDRLASRLAARAYGAALILQGKDYVDREAMREEISRDLVDLAAALAARLRNASEKPG